MDGGGDDLSSEWLYAEVMQCLPDTVIEQAQVRQQVNVQLMIDNIVVEPKLLGDILANLESYIKRQGEYLVREKLIELEKRFSDIFAPLEEATRTATEKIRTEFDIKDDEDE
jgi:hypothetical protein